MNNTDTPQIDYFNNAKTLAQAKVEEIKSNLAQIQVRLQKLDDEIAAITTAVNSDWTSALGNSAKLADAQEDVERLHRQRNLLAVAAVAGKRELNKAERQVVVDGILAVRSKFDRIMTERTTKARNIEATCYQLVAMIKEIDHDADKARDLFTMNRAETGLTTHEAMRAGGGVNYQMYVEEILAGELGKLLWDAVERPFPGSPARLAGVCDRGRRAIIAGINLFLDRLSAADPDLSVEDAVISVTT